MRVPIPAAMITTSKTASIVSPVAVPRRHRAAIIGGAFCIVLLLGLAACSRVTLAYRQADVLAMWWLDSQLDLRGEQRRRVAAELASLGAWHRRHRLPELIAQLQRWQSLSAGDVSAEQVCLEWAQLRAHWNDLGAQAAPAAVRVLAGLGVDQRKHLRKRQAESNDEFAERYLGDAKAAMGHRMERAQERVELFYGRVDDAQIQAMQRDLEADGFDAAWVVDLRRRRQAALLQMVERMQMGALSPHDAEAAWLSWWHAALDPPSPQDKGRWQSRVQGACRAVAAIHGRSTPAQRQHAVRTLGAWIASLQELAPP